MDWKALTNWDPLDFGMRKLDRLTVQREHAVEGLDKYFSLVQHLVSNAGGI